MGWPVIPPVGRGLITVAALLVPLVLVLALLPTILAWPFLPAARQERLQGLLDLVLKGTSKILTRSLRPPQQ
ncbi:hypothetical protein ACRYCC_43005 [Actinomadura scrupuli]|uniref:hypothetical protein n=1 Tax=Actinomadura scrupuli TaxID=559629 RepID=UPI003D96A7C1